MMMMDEGVGAIRPATTQKNDRNNKQSIHYLLTT